MIFKDVDEWLLTKQIDPLVELKIENQGGTIFLADLLEMYLSEQLAFTNIDFDKKIQFVANHS
tara:strand:- start:44458 stop:44646 length:189 start_codon:yes stop_codon:yes gene_type:complete